MGFLDKVKGFMNVGGVKVTMIKVPEPFPRGDTTMGGGFTLETDSDKTILSTSVEFYAERRKRKEDGEDEITKTVLGTQSSKDYLANTDYPFDMVKGESKQMSFVMINVNVEGTMAKMAEKGGFMGAIGKAAQLAGKLTDSGDVRYYVEVTADVKGTPFDPSNKLEIRVI